MVTTGYGVSMSVVALVDTGLEMEACPHMQ